MAKLINDINYKKPLIQIDDELSDHYNKNIENQIAGAKSECVICGKGIKSSSKHYTIVAGLGNYSQFIHRDEWDYAESEKNTDGGFMGAWDIGSECYKKLKDFPNIKDYVDKNF
jgi:hypothetical protein